MHAETIRCRSKTKDVLTRTLAGDMSLEIVAEDEASATVFLTVGEGMVRIAADVKRGASLTVVCLQSSEKKSSISERATVAEGGHIRWHNITLGSDVTHDLRSELSGAHARSDVDWIFHVTGNGKQTLNARNIFDAADGKGEITMKGVAEGTANAECNGMIEITEKGRGTDTYLTEDVLMLDTSAKVDAIPALEIRTNDVKASHSATISRVTAEDLFYFQSRGIEEGNARRLYVEGFLADLTQRVEDSEVRAAIDAALVAPVSLLPQIH